MKTHTIHLALAFFTLGLLSAVAQETVPNPFANSSAPVPRLIRFSGLARDGNNKSLAGTIGITFLLYQDQQGGAPLWMETQNVQPDSAGHYSVQLGATKSDGIPTDVFTSGEARWIGVQISEQTEQQPRVLLVSVPYAIKARDADTLGGKPASAYVLSAQQTKAISASGETTLPPTHNDNTSKSSTNPNSPALGGTGTPNTLPLWTSSTNLGNSALFQVGTGSSATVITNSAVGIGTSSLKGQLTVQATSPSTTTAVLSKFSNGKLLSGFLRNSEVFSVDTSGSLTLGDFGNLTMAGNLTAAGSLSGASVTTAGPIMGTTLTAKNGSATNETAQFSALAKGPWVSDVHFGSTGDWYIRSAAVKGKVILQDNGGNVGIGTQNPGASLHVVSNAFSTARFSAPNKGSWQSEVQYGSTGDWYIRSAAAGGVVILQDNGGKVGIGTGVPAHHLDMGDGAYEEGGSWTNASDRNLKENFIAVDNPQLLSKINAMSIETWNYKSEGKSVRHLGPVAQDFYAAFGLGQDDKHISTVDEGGVALVVVWASIDDDSF